jgi:hypothetical protein
MELIVSVASMIIALVALIVAIGDGRTSRRHDQLSVTPHLSIRSNKKATANGQVYDAEITVENTGIGPAVIGSFQVLINGKAMTGEYGGWSEARTVLGIESLGPDFYWLGKKDYVGAGETKTLFHCGAQPQDQREIQILEQALRQLSIRIEYESVYGQHYEEQWP